jgi:hypothetical protein
MSHAYTIYEGNNPTNKVLTSTILSNTSHEDWQEKAGLDRLLVPRDNPDPALAVKAPFHTTVWDDKPICLDLDEFDEYLDKACDAYGDDTMPEHMQELYDLSATARALQETNFDGEDVYIYVF